MEFRQLQSFAALVECRSFSKVANELYISQPTVSTHIRNLEKELGTKLVIRSTHSVDITDKGMELYDFAVNVLERRDKLMKHWSEDEKNVVKLGASTIPSAYLVPDIIKGFSKKNPDVRIMLDQTDSALVIEGVKKGKYDVGFSGMKTEEAGLIFTPVYDDEMVLITPNDDEFKAWESRQITADDLKNLPFLRREEGSGSQSTADGILEKMGLNPDEINEAGKVSNQDSLKKLVSSGIGVAFISKCVVSEEVKRGELFSFDIPGFDTKRSLYMVILKDEGAGSGAKAFAEYVINE